MGGECAWGFAEAISVRFTALGNLRAPVLMWDTFKCEMLDAAQESIGECPRARQYYLTGDTEGHRSLSCGSSDGIAI